MITVNPKSNPYDVWTDTNRLHVASLLVFTGSYVTGGDLCSLNQYRIKSATTPYVALVNGLGGIKYQYSFIPGPTPATCKVKITDTTTGSELAAGPYPAAVLNDTVTLYDITLSMQ